MVKRNPPKEQEAEQGARSAKTPDSEVRRLNGRNWEAVVAEEIQRLSRNFGNIGYDNLGDASQKARIWCNDYRSYKRVIGEPNPLAYLRRSLRNIYLQEYRRLACLKQRESNLEDSIENGVATDTVSFEERSVRCLDHQRIVDAFVTLNQRQRAVMVLYDDGFSMSEIAKELGITIGAVASSFDRAKTCLRRVLGVEGESLVHH